MKYVGITNFIITVVFITLFTPIVEAEDLRFIAEVDKTQMYSEDVLTLSFVISGENIVTPLTPELPDPKNDFDILQGPNQSSTISIINGKYTSSISWHYVLSPKKTGKLEIRSATLQYDNKTYTTKPLTIEVIKGSQSQSPPSPPGTELPQPGDNSGTVSAPDVYLRAEVDKQTAYIGEQVTLSYYLYTRINISGYDFTQQPNFTGFWVEDLDIPKPPTLQYRTINGVRYGVALLKKVALFPTSSGDVTIDPMAMKLGVKVQTRSRDPFDQFFNDPFDNFFGRTEEIIRKTQPIALKILPLPEDNKPATFNGDIGNFTMSVAVDKAEIKQDEPITLTVKIQGTGNIKTVKEPVITLPESFKRYDPEITENVFPLQEPVQGEKTFKSVVIPSAPGKYRIEPVQFSYFDPQHKTYQTIRSEPINVVILPTAQEQEPLERRIATKEEIKLLGQDIRFIKTDIPRLVNQEQDWYQRGLFYVLLIVPLLVIGAAYGYKHYHKKYGSDERYIRKKKAKKLSRTHLKTTHDLMNRGEAKEFYAAISTTLRQYLGNKLNLPPAGITGEEIGQELVEQGLDEETATLLKQCLADCDFARFAPVGSSVGEMNAMLHKAETIIERVEKL
jgi:hypothetical protein